MAIRFEWIKLAVENSKIVMPLLLLLMSATGYTVNDNLNKSKEIKAAQDQLANVANFYANSKPVKKVKSITCGSCGKLINDHNKEYH